MNYIQADELFKSLDLSNKGYITKEDISRIDFMTEEVKSKIKSFLFIYRFLCILNKVAESQRN